MEYYQVFMEVILKEVKRFQLDTEICATYLNQLTCSLDQNFDVPYNRCAYMFKYGTSNTYFFKDCVNQFLLDSNAKDILSEWKSHTEVKVYSLSVGPGLDYLAFILAVLEYDSSPPNFSDAKIVSRHGAWRNTVNFLLEVLREQGTIFDIAQYKLKYESVNVIQADFLTNFSGKFTIASLSDAHIVLMVRTLNLQAAGNPQEGSFLQMLKVLISSLRSDATIFCIDTKPSLALFTQAFSNFSGRFLFGPIHRTITIPCDFPENFGSRPTVNCRGAFFVWQKLETNLSTSHLSATSISTECESNLKVACGGDDVDVSTLSDSCSIADESITEYIDSVNLPWIELKTFWKSSSPKTKKIIKELMISDKEKIENIGDFISQSEKFDTNMHDTIQIETLNGAEPSYSQKPTLPTVSIIKNVTNDCSYGLVNCNSFDDIVRSSPIETDNSENSIIYENFTLPDTNEVDTSVLSSREKLSNYDVPVNIQSIKTKNDSEEYATVEDIDAGISSHSTAIPINSQGSTSSTSIKDLTDCIRQLVSSLEGMTQQNEPPNYNAINGSSNKCQSHLTPNSNIRDVPPCSKYSLNFGSTEENNLASSECGVEKNTFQCIDCHCSCQCCHNRCFQMQLNCQSSCRYVQPCSLTVPRCSLSCCRQQCRGKLEDITSPTIVIPLQNISEDALLKIVSVLK